MTEEEMKERIYKLEGEVKAADKALDLAYRSTHGIRAEAFAGLAILISLITLIVLLVKGR